MNKLILLNTTFLTVYYSKKRFLEQNVRRQACSMTPPAKTTAADWTTPSWWWDTVILAGQEQLGRRSWCPGTRGTLSLRATRSCNGVSNHDTYIILLTTLWVLSSQYDNVMWYWHKFLFNNILKLYLFISVLKYFLVIPKLMIASIWIQV